MGRHTDKLERLYEKLGDPDLRESFFATIDGHLDRLSKSNPATYKHAVDNIEGVICSIDKGEAFEIVRKMTPRGQMWSFDAVKSLMEQHEIKGNPIHYYLVLNMVYNDYYNTAATYGLDKDINFYLALAKDFINDPDGKPYKVEKYFAS